MIMVGIGVMISREMEGSEVGVIGLWAVSGQEGFGIKQLYNIDSPENPRSKR